MYEELIKAIRCEGKVEEECIADGCKYFGDDGWCDERKIELDAADALEAAEKRIAELEAQLPKEGEWIEENRRPKSYAFVCSECGRTAYDVQPTRGEWSKRCRYAYCPNCGARMKGEQE